MDFATEPISESDYHPRSRTAQTHDFVQLELLRKGFDDLLPVLLRECRLINRAATRIGGVLSLAIRRRRRHTDQFLDRAV
jgi:hypothetical protein